MSFTVFNFKLICRWHTHQTVHNVVGLNSDKLKHIYSCTRSYIAFCKQGWTLAPQFPANSTCSGLVTIWTVLLLDTTLSSCSIASLFSIASLLPRVSCVKWRSIVQSQLSNNGSEAESPWSSLFNYIGGCHLITAGWAKAVYWTNTHISVHTHTLMQN